MKTNFFEKQIFGEKIISCKWSGKRKSEIEIYSMKYFKFESILTVTMYSVFATVSNCDYVALPILM